MRIFRAGLLFALTAAVSFAQTPAPSPTTPPPVPELESAAEKGAPEKGASIPEAYGDRALVVSLNTFVDSGEGAAPWTSRETKYTIPGTAVSAKLVGKNVVIVISLTPYLQKADGLVIVTQQQVWIRSATGEVNYQTTLNTFNIKYDEPVVFYPLGVVSKGKAPVKVEVLVSRYKTGSDPSAPGAAPGPVKP